jgi:hypothetical protein
MKGAFPCQFRWQYIADVSTTCIFDFFNEEPALKNLIIDGDAGGARPKYIMTSLFLC